MSDETAPGPGALVAGSRIAGYLLQEQIGRGGMAVVFRAHDERLDRQVALKVLAPALAADDTFRQRFIRESRAAAAVDDPHIIPVFEAGEAGGVLYIAMRYVRGGDVGSLVRRRGSLTVSRVAAIIAPVASALDAAHEAGLVHRDVKPANMLVDVRPGRPEHVYVSDFGLTKGVLAQGGLTGTGQFLGTLDYVAPEQIRGEAVDGRADQYALAAAAMEMLTGSPPFSAEEPTAVMYAHLSQPPPAASARRPDLPRAADAVLARALAKNPADRYASCRDFSEALRAAVGMAGYDSSGAEVVPPAEPVRPVQPLPAGAGTEWVTTADSPPSPPSTRPEFRGTPRLVGTPRRRGTARRRAPAWPAAIAAGVAVIIGSAVYLVTHSGSGTGSPGGHSSPAVPGGATCANAPSPGAVNWSAAPASRPLIQLGTSHASIVEGMSMSPDGATVAVGTAGGATYLVDVASGAVRQTLTQPGGGAVESVAFSCDGTKLAVAENNGSTYMWTIAHRRSVTSATLTDPGTAGVKVLAVAFSPDGTTLAAGDSAGSTYLWRVGSPGATPVTLTDPAASTVQAVAFSPDGTTLATGDAAGGTYLWRVGSPGASPVTLTDPAGSGVQAVAFSPDGTTLATGDAAGGVYLWRVRGTRHSRRPLPGPGPPGAFGTVAVAYNGSTVAAGGYTGQTYLWNSATGIMMAQLNDPGIGAGNVQSVVFSPDGSLLVTGDTNGNCYVWKSS